MGIDALAFSDTPGMANPMQVKSILEKLLPETKDIPVILHLHNTRGLGLVNVMAALECGITRFGVEVAAKVSHQKVDINLEMESIGVLAYGK